MERFGQSVPSWPYYYIVQCYILQHYTLATVYFCTTLLGLHYILYYQQSSLLESSRSPVPSTTFYFYTVLSGLCYNSQLPIFHVVWPSTSFSTTYNMSPGPFTFFYVNSTFLYFTLASYLSPGYVLYQGISSCAIISHCLKHH